MGFEALLMTNAATLINGNTILFSSSLLLSPLETSQLSLSLLMLLFHNLMIDFKMRLERSMFLFRFVCGDVVMNVGECDCDSEIKKRRRREEEEKKKRREKKKKREEERRREGEKKREEVKFRGRKVCEASDN